MAELADAADSKSAGLRLLGVRFPLPAPLRIDEKQMVLRASMTVLALRGGQGRRSTPRATTSSKPCNVERKFRTPACVEITARLNEDGTAIHHNRLRGISLHIQLGFTKLSEPGLSLTMA